LRGRGTFQARRAWILGLIVINGRGYGQITVCCLNRLGMATLTNLCRSTVRSAAPVVGVPQQIQKSSSHPSSQNLQWPSALRFRVRFTGAYCRGNSPSASHSPSCKSGITVPPLREYAASGPTSFLRAPPDFEMRDHHDGRRVREPNTSQADQKPIVQPARTRTAQFSGQPTASTPPTIAKGTFARISIRLPSCRSHHEQD